MRKLNRLIEVIELPDAVAYPDNIRYCRLKPEDAEKILKEHFGHNKPVERKFLPDGII